MIGKGQVTRNSIKEYAEAIKNRNRKAAIRLLNCRSPATRSKRSGRPPRYGITSVEVLRVVWETSDRLCSKRLHPFLPELIKVLRRCAESKMTAEIEAELSEGSDEQIENWNTSLRNMRDAGIKLLLYGWQFDAGASMPMWRTSAANVGRGGTRILQFDASIAKKTGVTDYGEILEETMWDRLTYFLKAVIPVAEEAGIRMAMHPADPQVSNLSGIARIVRNIEAYNRVFQIMPSRANCMTFCLGCFGQMMNNEDVYEAIRHFGKEDRIGYVHFRGVRGTLEKFDEVFPDEGGLDMLKAVEVLKEVGFNGIIQIDHGPRPTGDSEFGHISHAFQIGYLKGIIQGVNALE